MGELQYIIKGIVVGLMVSVPLGPMGVLIIQKTLHKGKLAGFIAGLGAASADTFYAVVATFGFGFIVNFIESQEFWLQFAGSIVVVIIGLKIYFANPIKQYKAQREAKVGFFSDFVSLFFLTASNPVVVFFFIATFAGTSIFGTEPTMVNEAMVIIGVFLGATFWWYTLSTIIDLFRKKFRLRSLFVINRVSGVIISILGLFMFISLFEPIKSLLKCLA